MISGTDKAKTLGTQSVVEEGPHIDGRHAHATAEAEKDMTVSRELEGQEPEHRECLGEETELITNDCRSLVCAQQGEETTGMTANEAVAYGKLKSFCSNIIKRLAPPLLREVQASQLRPEAEPFTPKRTTRASKKTTATKRPRDNPAENVPPQALGMVPDDLEVDDGVVHELKALFDSPLREQHVRIIAALFGKTIPSAEEMEAQNAVMVCVN